MGNASAAASATTTLQPVMSKRHIVDTDDDITVRNRDGNAIKGTEAIQLIVDDDYDEHDMHVSVDAAAEIADDPDKTNQSQYHLTYSKLNDKLREKLTPIFNRKHYSSLPQTSLSYFDNKSRKNSYNYSAYITKEIKYKKYIPIIFVQRRFSIYILQFFVILFCYRLYQFVCMFCHVRSFFKFSSPIISLNERLNWVILTNVIFTFTSPQN